MPYGIWSRGLLPRKHRTKNKHWTVQAHTHTHNAKTHNEETNYYYCIWTCDFLTYSAQVIQRAHSNPFQCIDWICMQRVMYALVWKSRTNYLIITSNSTNEKKNWDSLWMRVDWHMEFYSTNGILGRFFFGQLSCCEYSKSGRFICALVHAFVMRINERRHSIRTHCKFSSLAHYSQFTANRP